MINTVDEAARMLREISDYLERLATKNENKWPVDLMILVDQQSFEAYRMSNDLMDRKNFLGV